MDNGRSSREYSVIVIFLVGSSGYSGSCTSTSVSTILYPDNALKCSFSTSRSLSPPKKEKKILVSSFVKLVFKAEAKVSFSPNGLAVVGSGR